MLAKPGIVDANVLVYAFDADAPQHLAWRRLLEAGRNRLSTLHVTLQILCEFYSILTNPRRVAKPRSVSDVITAIGDLVSFLQVLPILSRMKTDTAACGDIIEKTHSEPSLSKQVRVCSPIIKYEQ